MSSDVAADPFQNYGYAVLTANALAAPGRIALTHQGGPGLSYDALNRAVNRRAHALSALGVRPGERVAALLGGTLAVAEIYLALFKIGAVTVALNPFWDAGVLAHAVGRSRATVLVHDGGTDALAAAVRPRLPGVRSWVRAGGPAEGAADLDALTAAAPGTEPEIHGSGDDPLALFHTSGSTGAPKAVVHSHASALATARLWQDVPRGDDAVFGTGAIIWGIGFPSIAGPALYGGLRLVLEQEWSPRTLLTVVPREKVTHISVIPSFFASLLADDAHAGADLSSLRTIILGGEPIAPALLARVRERLPQAAVYGYYGQTEAPYSAFGRIDGAGRDPRSVGRARTGCAIRVTDPSGTPLVDEVGEINLAGPHRMLGYDGAPEQTAEVLRGPWFVGGDLGRIDAEGRLRVLGRRSDAILKHGRWTPPAVIEEAAAELDEVAEAGAVGRPANPDGAEPAEQEVVLAVVPRAGSDPAPARIAAALAARLPAHQRPDRVVVTDRLPHGRDASGGPGKLLRSEIRVLHAAGEDP
ncbi:class I adenylate-forming enzyme family protein [Nocardiopsis sediminis]|uniref:Class I adenylate-forming enzyme family protein n=1 Tax=Nocardiopsis sediminis TaxID=1778267 RepID=A0ABV8FX52_9ACTN